MLGFWKTNQGSHLLQLFRPPGRGWFIPGQGFSENGSHNQLGLVLKMQIPGLHPRPPRIRIAGREAREPAFRHGASSAIKGVTRQFPSPIAVG